MFRRAGREDVSRAIHVVPVACLPITDGDLPMNPALPMTMLSLALAITLAACGDRRVDAGDDAATPAAPASTWDQPEEDIPPATAPAGSVMPGEADAAAGDARFDGYGAARFGMDAGHVKSVWGGELNGNAAEGESCFHLNPVGQPDIAYFALMFEDGKFVRYSVSSDELVAPGGGRRGMDIAQIQQLYPGRIEQSNHKYVQGGHYLRIKDAAGGNGVLVLETDADGVVTEWRVGVPPQVDYVEGCS